MCSLGIVCACRNRAEISGVARGFGVQGQIENLEFIYKEFRTPLFGVCASLYGIL